MGIVLKAAGVVALAFVAYVAYWFYADGSARSEARAFCDSIAIGSPMSAADDALKTRADVRHGFMSSENVYIASFKGPIFNAYTCELSIADGKVAARNVIEPAD